jgi:hypothetical protein
MTVADRIVERRGLTIYTLALNYLPLAQLSAGAAVIATQTTSIGEAIVWSLVWLYLLPPLVCRLTLIVLGTPHGQALSQQDRAYKV